MKRILQFLLAILMCGIAISPLSAQDNNTLTVHDGSTTNGFVPVYGFYADAYLKAEFVMPADELADMTGGDITGMKFYATQTNVSWGNANFQVFLTEVSETTIGSFISSSEAATVVYTGSLSIVNGEMEVTFSTPYTYSGGNLLIGVHCTEKGSYVTSTWYGENVSGASVQGYNYSSLYDVAANQRNFLPKTTFTYSGGALCRTPQGVTASGFTTTGATISWSGSENVSYYMVRYMPASQTDWESATETSTNETTMDLTDLIPSTQYKVRVQAICEDESTTGWSLVCSFMTECGAITIEDSWSEDFEENYSGSDVARPFLCWATPVQSTGGGNGPFVYCGHGESCHSGVNSAELKADLNYMNILVLPEFANDLNTLRLTFWATSTNPSSENGRLEVGVMADASDTSTFELVGVCSTPGSRGSSNAGNGLLMGPFDFNNIQVTSGRIALRFYGDGDGSYYNGTLSWNLDDFTVTFIPDCAEPTGLTLGNVTSSTAEISWNQNEGYTYDVVRISGSDTVVLEGATLNEGAFLLEDLSPNENYTCYVRTDCGGSYANSLQRLTFTTLNLPVDLPYNQDFETEPESITDFVFSGSGNNQWVIGSATGVPDGEEVHSMYISNDNGVSNAYTNTSTSNAYAVLDVVFPEDPMEYHLIFDYKVKGEGSNWDYLSVYLIDALAELPSPSSTNHALLYQATDVLEWTHVDTILENVVGTSKKIVFFWHNDDYYGENPPAAVDNISIIGSTCGQPNALAVSGVTTDAAVLSWTENGTSSDWTVYYKEKGSTEAYQQESVSGEPTMEFTGLTANTGYECYVVSECGDMSSAPSAHLTFHTSCDAISVSEEIWTSDFEGTDEQYLTCWVSASTGSRNGHTYPHIEPTSSIAHNSTSALEIAFGDIVTALPAFVEDISTLELTFWAMCNYYNSSYSNNLELGYITEPNDATTFVPMDTLHHTGYQRIVRSFSDLAGLDLPSTTRIAFRFVRESSSNLTSWYLDDMQVNLIPTCAAPVYNSVTVSEVTHESAVVAFTDNDETHTNWVIYYRPVGSTEEYTIIPATTTEGTMISDLAVNTTYTVYVKTECSGEESQSQTDAVQFTTTTIPAELPLTENFEEEEDMQWVLLNGTQNNKWYVGAPTDSASNVNTTEEGSRGLYISNDNGASNTYAYSGYGSESRVYAYRDVLVPDGATDLLLSFDWKANGRNKNYEFLRVYWLDPAVVTLTPGSNPPGGYDAAGQPGNYGEDASEHWLARETEWQHEEMLISASQFEGMGDGDKVYRLVFHWRDSYSYSGVSNPPAAVDNVQLRVLDCSTPTQLSVSNITSTSALLTWEGDAEEYAVYLYGPDTTYEVVSGNSTSLVLAASSAYTAYVRAICGNDSSMLSTALHFNSGCDAVEIPWTENFDSYVGTNPISLLCWQTPLTSEQSNGTFPAIWSDWAAACHSGNASLEMKAGDGQVIMAVLPEFAGNIEDLRISFWATTTNLNYGLLEIGVLPNPDSVNSFIPLYTATEAGPRNNSGSVSGNGVFLGPFDFNAAEVTEGRIALRYQGASYYGDPVSWNLDDITVELTPNCPSPVKNSVQISYVDGHSATITFVDNDPDHDSWTVYYKKVSDLDWQSWPTQEQTATITGLDPQTSYVVYVVTNCLVPDEVQDATNVMGFTTTVTCPPPTNVAVEATATEAIVTWVGSADSYTVVCGDFTETVEGNTTTITGLSASTNYTVSIIADCGVEGTSTAATANFMTACDIVTQFPYAEPFDDYDLGCWTNENLEGSNSWSTSSNYSVSGRSAYFSWTNYTSSNLISPVFDLSGLTTPYVSFYHYLRPYSGRADTLVVFYRTSLSSEWVRLAGFTTPDNEMHMDSLALPEPSDSYQICFRGYGIDGFGIYVDNVAVYSAAPAGPVQPTVTTNNASPVSTNSATLKGTIHNPDNLPYMSPGFQWKMTNGGTYSSVSANVSGNSMTYELTDLTTNTNYTFRAFIIVDGDTVFGGTKSFTTHSVMPTQPTVATNDVENLTTNAATLKGTITNPDNVAISAQGFRWKAAVGGTNAFVAATVSNNAMTAELSGLAAGTVYRYCAYIVTSADTIYGNEKIFETEDEQGTCATPTGVTPSNITKESITVSWDDAEGVYSWKVQYRPVGGTFSSGTTESYSYVISGLTAQTEYEIQVQALCDEGSESEWTEIITVTTLPDGVNSYLENSVTLYPNPAKEVVNVQCTMNNVQWNGAVIEVLDVYGKLLQTLKADSEITQINVRNLANGMYFVRMTTGEGVVTKPFVKK